MNKVQVSVLRRKGSSRAKRLETLEGSGLRAIAPSSKTATSWRAESEARTDGCQWRHRVPRGNHGAGKEGACSHEGARKFISIVARLWYEEYSLDLQLAREGLSNNG